jgi:hypothetical protein
MQIRIWVLSIAIATGLAVSDGWPASAPDTRAGASDTEPPGGIASGLIHYRDGFRGWPVRPLHAQHPVRSGFLDPRAPGRSREYHTGIDFGVRDDRPEIGAPRGRTHRVYAIEGGRAVISPRQARTSCANRKVVIGHFEYWHVDTVRVVPAGEKVRPGQTIGWTCAGLWHVHLSERLLGLGTATWVNPLRPGGKVAPYVDHSPPTIRAIRFFTPAFAGWSIRGRPAALVRRGHSATAE